MPTKYLIISIFCCLMMLSVSACHAQKASGCHAQKAAETTTPALLTAKDSSDAPSDLPSASDKPSTAAAPSGDIDLNAFLTAKDSIGTVQAKAEAIANQPIFNYRLIQEIKSNSWASMESGFPLPVLKHKASDNLASALEKQLNATCRPASNSLTVDQKTLQLYFCAWEPEFFEHQTASDNTFDRRVDQLAIYMDVLEQSSQTHRVYLLEDKGAFSDAGTDEYELQYQLVHAESQAFLDTNALFVKLLKSTSDLHEHSCPCTAGCDVNNYWFEVTNLILVGDKSRPAAKWSEYTSWLQRNQMNCDVMENPDDPDGEEIVINYAPYADIVEEVFEGVFDSEAMKAVSQTKHTDRYNGRD